VIFRLLAVRLLAALPLAWCAPHLAAESLDIATLAEQQRCNACHHESEPLLGPPWIAIAARHAAQAEVMGDGIVEVLAQKIISGGAGNWGVVPMVPNEQVTIEQARAMARWILELEQP
jgi:cytochrome c